MGGKTKTVTDIGAEAIFKEDDNLLIKEYIRQFALLKKIDIPTFGKEAILSINEYFHSAIFDRLGITSTSFVKSAQLDDGSVYDDINEDIECDEWGNCPTDVHVEYQKVMYYISSKQYDNTPITSDTFKIKKQLEEQFPVSDQFSLTYTYTLEMKVYPIEGSNTTLTGLEVFQMKHGTTDKDVYDLKIMTNAYQIDGKWYAISEDKIYVNDEAYLWRLYCYLEELDDTWQLTGNKIKFDLYEDYKPITVCRYAWIPQNASGSVNDPDSWEESEYKYIDKELYEHVVTEYKALVYPLKKDFELLDLPGYQKVVLNHWGLGNGLLDESLNQPELKDAMVTYSANRDTPLVGEMVDYLYGNSFGFGLNALVTLESEYFSILYGDQYPEYGKVTEDPSQFSEYRIEVNGTSFTVGDKALFILPVNVLEKTTVNEKYEILKYTFRIIGVASQQIEVKWYQTGFFKVLVLIVTLAIAIYTGSAVMALLALGGQAISGMLTGLLGQHGSQIAIFIIAAVTTFSGNISGVMNYFNVAVNLSQQAFNIYLGYEVEDIADDMADYKDEAEEYTKIIDELRNDTLYVPMDSYDRQFYTAYDLLYNSYSDSIDSLYDYDRLLTPKGLI